MKQYTKTHEEYTIPAFLFACLALIGSFLSIINFIPLIITYQLMQEAKRTHISQFHYRLISCLLILAIFLTCFMTFLYTHI